MVIAKVTRTISFDLSHIGSLVDPQAGITNALQIAAAGTHLMISSEGSERNDLVLNIFEQVSDVFAQTGITLQARLNRIAENPERVFLAISDLG